MIGSCSCLDQQIMKAIYRENKPKECLNFEHVEIEAWIFMIGFYIEYLCMSPFFETEKKRLLIDQAFQQSIIIKVKPIQQ